jgi:hypothetical protein
MKKGTIAGIVALIVVAGIGVKMYLSPDAQSSVDPRSSVDSQALTVSVGGSRRRKRHQKNKKTKRS